MAEKTNIVWCDATWSPWYGCTQVSLGEKGACEHCYARFMWEERYHRVTFGGPGRGEGTRDIRAEAAWKDPIRWNANPARLIGEARAAAGERPFIFPSACDPFDNHPALPQARRRFFDLIRATPKLTWLPLTKRPGNIVGLYRYAMGLGEPSRADPRSFDAEWPRNAAIGFTAVTQEEFDRDWPKAKYAFETLNAPFVMVSYEPAMGPLVLPADFLSLGGRAWIIAGGETNQGAHRARPSDPAWFRALRDQCLAAGALFTFKQWGEWQPAGPQVRSDAPWHTFHGERHVYRAGKAHDPCTLDGVRYDARPEVARG